MDRSNFRIEILAISSLLYALGRKVLNRYMLFYFLQVFAIEPSFFKTMSGMHHHPFEGRHLVFVGFVLVFFQKAYEIQYGYS